MAEKITGEAIVTVTADGQVVIGQGYNLGQILGAIEQARRAVLGLVLRPEGQTEAEDARRPA